MTLKPWVELYGGFKGNERTRQERDFVLNKTILSGENQAYHVVTGVTNALLDGFIVTGGSADGDGETQKSGGGLRNLGANTVVVNCTFTDNYAIYGGAISNGASSAVTVSHCVFTNNRATRGGAIYSNDSMLTLTNSVFYQNRSTLHGGALYNWLTSPIILNTTIVANESSANGAGMCNYETSKPLLTNSIVWGNTAGGENPQIHNGNDCETFISYSDIEGGDGSGTNIAQDPLFQDLAGGDLRLTEESPCIGKADASRAPETDVENKLRDTAPDMGAYEY